MRGFSSRLGIQLITGLILLAWPFLVWFGLTYHSLNWLLPLMVLLLLLRLYKARQAAGSMRFMVQGGLLAGIVLCSASYLLKSYQLLLFYPVTMNLVMLAIFGASLWSKMSMVERFARLHEPNLSPAGVRYTRRVTQVWCLFFIFNGSVALFTALYGDMRIWTTWNGMIAYLLMGVLMAGEWLVRGRLIKRETS